MNVIVLKIPFTIKIFILSIFEWPFCTGFTVFTKLVHQGLMGELWPFAALCPIGLELVVQIHLPVPTFIPLTSQSLCSMSQLNAFVCVSIHMYVHPSFMPAESA